MDTSKVSVCALLVLLGVLGAHGFRSQRSAGGGNGASSGASSYSGAMPTPYFGPGADLHNSIQEHFKSVQAHHDAIKARIEEQIRAQQQASAGGSWATGSALMTNADGSINPNAQVYTYTYTSPHSGMVSSSANSGYGGMRQQPAISFAQSYPSRIHSTWNRFADAESAAGNSGSNYGSGYPSSSSGPQSAIASVSLGPNGGFQSGQISPAEPGIFSRFGEDIPAPSGGSIGVFSSSSSSHSVGPDGKETSHKSATTGVNDNGKVTIKTVHDP